jgi:hypothetical protein
MYDNAMKTSLLTLLNLMSLLLMVVRNMLKSLLALVLLFTDIYTLKSMSMFPSVLSDHIIDCGAPMCLLSNSAKVEMSKQVKDILHTYVMGCWQSKPYHQHQYPVEWHYQGVKHMCNTFLVLTGAPAYCWLLCLMYVCLVLNLSYSDNIKMMPLQLALGTTNDISPLFYFTFY